MKYYAIGNDYGSKTCQGFSNTYYCLVFSSKKSRDEWVEEAEAHDNSVQPIRRNEIGMYIGRPKAFSGKALVFAAYSDENEIAGCLGTVALDYPGPHNRRVFGGA